MRLLDGRHNPSICLQSHDGIHPPFQAEAIQKLVSLGAHVNAINDMAYTPLHYAAMEGCSSALKRLLRLGADVSLANDEGRTPLQVGFLAKLGASGLLG